jgi:replicative DNA helicase
MDSVKEARKIELAYLELRKEVLTEVDASITRQRSIPMKDIKARVASKEKPKRIETGIRSLDMELVNEEMKAKGIRGGMALGNFVQMAGSRGVGKSSFMLKIITGFSLHEKVSWFDFEMGEDRVVEKLKHFTHDDTNLLYYSASRDISDISDEIKLLHASGVKHFVIDSAMKITTKGVDRYEKFSSISGEMALLTSSLGINIYMINQLSQSSERDGVLALKHGNDAEYEADYIFFILNKIKYDEKGKPEKDDDGHIVMRDDVRILKCTKNRQDERLFTVEIPKSEIVSTVIEITYEG